MTTSDGYRFELRLPLRHTDSFGGTPFVHGGVMLALTEIALDAYDAAAGIPSHRDVLRFQTHSELRYLAPLRWDDAAIVRMRCVEARAGRLRFECELAAASSGAPVARITHRYAYVNAQTGRAETPADWPAIAAAIRAYEPAPVAGGNDDTASTSASDSPSPRPGERGPGAEGSGEPGPEGEGSGERARAGEGPRGLGAPTDAGSGTVPPDTAGEREGRSPSQERGRADGSRGPEGRHLSRREPPASARP